MNKLRSVMPMRALTLSEAFAVAELQATKLLELLELRSPSVDIAKVAELPKIEVHLEPRHRMPTLAGFSQWSDGRWLIVINKDSVPGRRRFTLAHEFKHIIDHNAARIAYRNIGHGDKRRHDQQIELICNHFAACVLMPRTWVKRAWANGIQGEEELAGLFKVSVEAMHTRLVYLGFLEDTRKPLAEYFRTDALGTINATAA
ncbi:MAG: ImmA/IrrE family metallo-endopeptidase [Frankiaceae bacterium]|nr:ImmA/IrrE family metallo-endopeptidase [Frankiaceae bacterium]MBV9870772.1 ImmA/IrrE family metallo-endopeptidase [Frankiaceae bacterium]